MSTTLEQDIDALSDRLSAMTEQSHEPDEWAQINNMHLTVFELKAQLVELREREKRNLKQKGTSCNG